MIRKINKGSGQTAQTGTTGTAGTSGTTGTGSPSGGQIAGSVLNTAITEGTSLAAGILSAGGSYVIQAITGAFNSLVSLGTVANNNAAQTQQLYWYTAGDRNDDRETNNGFYIIVGLGIVALITFLIVKSRKSK